MSKKRKGKRMNEVNTQLAEGNLSDEAKAALLAAKEEAEKREKEVTGEPTPAM